MNAQLIAQRWAGCVKVLKDRVNNRSFWEALEASVPVTLEGDTLIIGFDSVNSNRVGVLQQTTNLNHVREAVEQGFGTPLNLRFIEGTMLADWQAVQERDARVAAMRQAEAVRPMREAAQSGSWEMLNEQISRVYVQMPFRSLPQGKARYVNEALYLLTEAMENPDLYPDEGDEISERSVARLLERIANTADMPATMLAFELERLRAWRKANPE